MRVRIIAVGTKMPSWVLEATQDYLKRFPREWSVEFVEIALGHRGKGQDTAKAIAKEGENMLAAIDDRERVIALDVQGKSWSTEQLSQQMQHWQMDARNVALLVGGPDGLAPECLAKAEQRWSLSALTLPHPLVRVLLAEQLYRGWSILKNHPYHK
ncbi:LSU methyltransferase [gamma proteobacterium IMCC1989]|jgi:23S rRNA (pseudouridine1915-N3)-methyltransferase|nr:LSU methyltransferase [gamma proteobacterium IMCC1989]